MGLRVHLRFYGCCQRLVDRANLDLTFPNDVSLRDLLLRSADIFGDGLQTEILDQTGLRATVELAIDSQM